MKRALVLASVLVCFAMVAPATARTGAFEGVGAFTTAKMITGSYPSGCGVEDPGWVGSGGLMLPSVDPVPVERGYTVRFPGGQVPPYRNSMVMVDSQRRLLLPEFHLCGRLGAVASAAGIGAGPWCGLTRGYDGKGRFTMEDALVSRRYYAALDVTDFGWPAAVGNVMPVRGTAVERAVAVNGLPLEETGVVYDLVGLFQMFEPPDALGMTHWDCLDTWSGETHWFLNGVFALDTRK